MTAAAFARLPNGQRHAAEKPAKPRKRKKAARPLQSEAQLMRQCLAWLRHNKVFHVRQNAGGGRVPWGGKMRPLQGNPEGTPDLFVAGNGVALWVELKSATGKLRPAQRAWAEAAEAAGLCVVVVRSLDQLIEALTVEGVIS